MKVSEFISLTTKELVDQIKQPCIVHFDIPIIPVETGAHSYHLAQKENPGLKFEDYVTWGIEVAANDVDFAGSRIRFDLEIQPKGWQNGYYRADQYKPV